MLHEHKQVSQLKNIDIETIIIYKGNELSLWKKSGASYTQVEVMLPFTDERYTRLKQISHIPVLITILLNHMMMHPEESEIIRIKLQGIIRKIDSIKPHLALLDTDDIHYQLLILSESRKLLLNISKEKHDLYLKKVEAALDYNSRIATEIQHNNLHMLMSCWLNKHDIYAENTRIIIVTPHGPKIGHIETQYFTRWLRVKLGRNDVENNWIYSIESLPSKISSLDCKKDIIDEFLLGTELNKIIGGQILGNSHAMLMDVLAKYSEDSLTKIYRS